MCLNVILFLLSFFLVYGVIGAQRCRNSSDKSFSIQPLNTIANGIELKGEKTGRYVLTWCTTLSNSTSKLDEIDWDVFVEILNNISNADECKNSDDRPTTHSHIVESTQLYLECNQSSDVCFSRNLSNIFTACYIFKNKLKYQLPNSTNERSTSFPPIKSYLTTDFLRKDFTDADTTAHCSDNSPTLLSFWYSKVIPIEEYNIFIFNETLTQGIDVREYCTVVEADTELHCAVDMQELGLHPGSYELKFSYEAPWTDGEVKSRQPITLKCDYAGQSQVIHAAQEERMPLWGVVLLGVCGLLLVAIALVWTRSVWPEKVQRIWTTVQGVHPHVTAGASYHSVLLVYARDNCLFNDAMQRLAELLRSATGLEVVDLHHPETCARMAAAPALFIQECFLHSYVVVVAGPVLHRFSQDARVMCLPPQTSDSHLRLLLTLLRQRAHSAHALPYKQLFMCYMSESPTVKEEEKTLSDVVPYTRFGLPQGVAALLEYLEPGPQRRESELEAALVVEEPRVPAELFRSFSTALHQYTEFARHNPDYLDDLLITMT